MQVAFLAGSAPYPTGVGGDTTRTVPA